MAASTVVLSEQIRPWYNAGLRFLFDEDGSIAQAMADAQSARQITQQSVPASQPVPQSQQYSAQPHAVPPSQGAHSASAEQRPSLREQPSQNQHTTPQQHSSQQPTSQQNYAQQQDARGQQSPARRPAQATPSRAVPPRHSPSLVIHPTNKSPEEWPEQWQGYWAKAHVPSPVVWTYWSLGDDLSGHADPKRREVLKKLIGSLHLPRGTSSFWPVAASGQHPDELTPAPEIFLAGLRRLRPRYSVVFGSKALKSFMPESTLRPYLFTQFLGHRLIALPDVDYLVKSPNMLAPVIAYLRTAIKLTR